MKIPRLFLVLCIDQPEVLTKKMTAIDKIITVWSSIHSNMSMINGILIDSQLFFEKSHTKSKKNGLPICAREKS